jgi:hypothetical protein
MRDKALTGLAVFMLVWLGGSTAVAQVSAGDSVTGSASLSSPVPPTGKISFSFAAHSGPSGEQASGAANWELTLPFGGHAAGGGSVTCLNVQGSGAIIGTFANGTATFFFVSVPDRSVGFGAFETATAPTVCPSGLSGPFSQFFEPRPMDFFDIAILDSPSLPTTKEQCKKGGWKTYGTFKSQGDCVSSVPRKAPTGIEPV